MLVGQQLGPFLIEKELGAGAMGAVYRGKYVKTGEAVAVKIMAPGLGTTSDSASLRFQREANILKQLKHPNIVRLFGVGKHQGIAYYAMEYVQGESLDHVMARRDRMSWEEVVDLGQQLCAALQHAHEKGIVHRDLKPSNLMILPDGTLKLTDFGIAKDLDVTQLTGANCTIGTASYMSPEQCRGDKDISYKSDLYSLGVLFYELITGRKPFVAESPMEIFMMHVNGAFVRPSRLVLDLPVWMDTLICQLMEKKAEARPLDAAMVSQVLGSIQEKVEAQQSAGVVAAQARRLDRPRGERNPGDEDREAARILLGKRKTKRKKKKNGRLPVWVQALGLLLVLGCIVTALVFALQPPSPEKLFKRAEKMMASLDSEQRDRAREGPIKEYLVRYGNLSNAQTEQIRKWAEDYDMAYLEQLLAKHVRHVKENKGLAVEVQPGQEAAFKAAVAEYDGDAGSARKSWLEAKETGSSDIVVLADRHLRLLADIAVMERALLEIREKAISDRRAPTDLDELRQQAYLAICQEKLGDQLNQEILGEQLGLKPRQIGDREGARRRYEQLRASAAKIESQRFWVLFATVKRKQMADSLKDNPDGEKTENREKFVSKLLAIAKQVYPSPNIKVAPVRSVPADVVALYASETAMEKVVDEAKKLVEEIDVIVFHKPSKPK